MVVWGVFLGNLLDELDMFFINNIPLSRDMGWGGDSCRLSKLARKLPIVLIIFAEG